MAELASGAVSSLLGVIRNEARLLRGVEEHVQFIKEEMQSMNSFLLHLARTAPPGGEHDEQVRTWMNQVRILATDCTNCIDRLVYRGNPDIHLGSDAGLRRCLLWAPWFLGKVAAQHRAAVQLRALKERAREVGERRQRYDVRVPEKQQQHPADPSPWAEAADAAGADEDGDGQGQPDHDSAAGSRRAAMFKARTLDDYFQGKIAEWTEQVHRGGIMVSTAVMAAQGADQEAIALAREALAVEGHRCVVVDITRVHMDFEPLRPQEILYYILHQLQLDAQVEIEHGDSQSQSSHQQYPAGSPEEWYWLYHRKREIKRAKESLLGEIKGDIGRVMGKLDKIKMGIQDQQLKGGDQHQQQLLLDLEQTKKVQELAQKPIDVLLQLMLLQQSAAQQDQATRSKGMRKLTLWYDNIHRATAEKLKMHIEAADVEQQQQEEDKRSDFYDARYGYVLTKVFGKASNSARPQEQDSTVEGQIKQAINKVTEMLQELHEDPGRQDPIPQDVSAETEQKFQEIKRRIQELMEHKWIADKITENHFKDDKRHLIIILRIGEKIDGSTWEQNRYALALLKWRVAGVLIVTTTKNTQQAKEYCIPQGEPIDFSLAGFYHDIVLQLTSHHKNEDHCNPQIIRDIFDECQQYEFCMKIFAHSVYARPKRSNEELSKLRSNLQAVSPKSFVGVALKMLKFSYNDLPKEYRSCLLYLAIFPQGRSIRRSTLIARWVVEGLITKEDWPTSVRRAERCFDDLINWGLVYPADIGGTGKAKSCMVDDRVHGFITMIAEKQHIVDARLSLHMAHHFSIFNDIRLRASDSIDNFLQMVSKVYHFSRLKVLDLEGSKCFDMKNKRYLKDICCNLLLLKYLNLKRTNIKGLPIEINNLHELEVLDIRQNNVRETATRNVRLLKLKRLLAGNIDPSPSGVHVPEKIEKMEDMEVLLGVKPRNSQDLNGIGHLYQLRKLGVVINNDNDLQYLLQAISDLHRSLQSLSITLPPPAQLKGTPSSRGPFSLKSPCPPKVLETLSINGTTKTEAIQLLADENNQPTKVTRSNTTELLQLLLANENNQLTKVTLSNTLLSPKDLEVLSKLPMLRCIRLQQVVYTNSKLTFKNDEFQKLKYFLLKGSNMTDIIFNDGATCELEKIVLSLSNDLNISGVDKLPRLEELELSNSSSSSYDNSATNNDQQNSNNTNIAAATNTTATTTTTTDATATTVPNTVVTTIPNITLTTAAAPSPTTAATDSSDIATADPTIDTATTAPAATTTATDTTITTTDTATTTNTNTNMLRSLLEKGTRIAKVILRGTTLKQDDLQILGKKSTIRCLVLLDTSYDKRQLTFNKNEFLKLNLLIVQCSDIAKISLTTISFTAGSCPKLEKFVTNIMSLYGIDDLPRLKELEFKGDPVPRELKLAVNKLKDRLHFTQYNSEN